MWYTIGIKVNSRVALYEDPHYYLVLHGTLGFSKAFCFHDYILPSHVGMAINGLELIQEKTYESTMTFPNDYGDITGVEIRVSKMQDDNGMPIDSVTVSWNDRSVTFDTNGLLI